MTGLLRLSMVVLALQACGDKDDSDSGSTAGTDGADGTDGTDGADGTEGGSSDRPAFADRPTDGAVVAEMRTASGTAQMVCPSGQSYGLSTESTWIFNVLNHGDVCTYPSGAGLVAVNNMPTTDLAAYPGGASQVEMDTGSLADRLYGHEATRFEQEVVSWDPSTRTLQAVLWVQWPDGEVTVWVDTPLN